MASNVKKKKPKHYSGYMKFPITGATNKAEFYHTCEWVGKFKDPINRKKIFSRPRKFHIEIHIRIEGAWVVSTLSTPYNKLDRSQLSQILHQYAVEDVTELLEHGKVYIDQSFFKISIKE